ncbi:GNAT family N-acetyltransferase [Auraticoccus monumenti]|uniref:GNAT family N-acetyltransferase n=1 Tax=Auraticoccus monumenti TaxID=675864 RepID=UPI0012FCBA3B|nr:GNAT family N-acetyltransferase [Auraticoccus monumenti]
MPAVPWTVRPAEPGDAADWVEVHLRGLAETYPQMPPAFVGSRRARQTEIVASTRAEIEDAGPDERYLVALDADDALVGIGHATRGAQEWERRLLARYPDDALGLQRGVRDPGLRQLTTLYTVSRVHGSGVGGAMAEALVGDEPAYLWIMTGNDRAEAFYRRRGFRRVSAAVPSGPTWFAWPMFQMAR